MAIDIDFTGAPPLDTSEGSRWMDLQRARKHLQDAGESPEVVAAFTTLLEAFLDLRALHDGTPPGMTRTASLLAYLNRLTGYQDVRDLPRISNAPLCACRHPRGQHDTDPPVCRGCLAEAQPGGEIVAHEYTPCTVASKNETNDSAA